MSLFINFWEVLVSAIMTLAKSEGSDIKEEVVKDAIEILDKAKEDFQRWIPLYVKRNITFDELIWLIKGQADVVQLKLLNYEGACKEELNNFFESLIKIISTTILKMFTPL